MQTKTLKQLKGLDTINNTLKSFGIVGDAACDPAEIAKAFAELATKYAKDIYETFTTMLAKVGADFIVGIVVLASKLVSGATTSWINNVLTDLLLGNFVGGLISILATVLSSVLGMEIYMMYLAVKALQDKLEKRVTLSKLLIKDINNILYLLESYQTLFSKKKILNDYTDVEQALKAIKKAQFHLGIEISRMSERDFIYGTPRVIQIGNVYKADNYIDQAIDYLSNGVYGKVTSRINNVKNKYSLRTEIPVIPTPGAWTSYFETLNQELVDTYFTYDAVPGTPAYLIEKQEKEALYKVILFELMAELPQIIQLLFIQQMLFSSTDFVLKRFPISANIFLETVPEWIMVNETLQSLFVRISNNISSVNGYGADGNSSSQELALRYNLGTYTLSDLNTNVKLFEALILMFPTIWKEIKNISGIYLTFLSEAEKQLQVTKEDIVSTIEEEPSPSTMLGKKLQWTGQLSLAKSWLKPVISQSAGFGIPGINGTINAIELQDFIDVTGEKIDRLKAYISIKNTDANTGEPFEAPGETAIQLAQSLFIPLFSNILLVLTSKNSNNVISQLQAIKFLLEKQVQLDLLEMAFTRDVILTAESHPGFVILNGIFSELLNNLGHNSMQELVTALSEGDISYVVAAVQNLDAAVDLIEIVMCAEGNTAPNYLDALSQAFSFSGIDLPGKKALESLQQDVLNSGIQDLKRKQKYMEILLEDVKRIEAASKTDDGSLLSSDSITKNKVSTPPITTILTDLKSVGIVVSNTQYIDDEFNQVLNGGI